MSNESSLGNKEIFAKNLQRYMSDYNVSRKDLADHLNIAYTTLSDWVNANKYPRINSIELLANYFGIEKSDLIEDKSNEYESATKYEVPVYRAVSCGNPFIADEDIVDYEEIDSKLRSQGDHFGLKLKGRSMEPKFSEGDVVIVRKQSDVDSGSIAVVRVNGDEATMKIVHKSPEGITLVATNTDEFLPRFYNNEQIQTLPVEIIGKVIELRAKF